MTYDFSKILKKPKRRNSYLEKLRNTIMKETPSQLFSKDFSYF